MAFKDCWFKLVNLVCRYSFLTNYEYGDVLTWGNLVSVWVVFNYWKFGGI
jgi:hypothetical protein